MSRKCHTSSPALAGARPRASAARPACRARLSSGATAVRGAGSQPGRREIGEQSTPFMPAERQSRWHAASEPLAESAMMRTGGAGTRVASHLRILFMERLAEVS